MLIDFDGVLAKPNSSLPQVCVSVCDVFMFVRISGGVVDILFLFLQPFNKKQHKKKKLKRLS